MKGMEKKAIIFTILLLICILILNFSFNAFHHFRLSKIAFWIISFGGAYFLYGYRKDKHILKIDTIQNVFIICFIYLIIIYISGLFFGYTKSPYNHEFIKVFINCFLALALIFLQEIFRYIFISKNNKLLIILVTCILIAFNIITEIGNYNFSDPMSVFKFIGYLVLPSIILNILMTFMTSKTGFWPSIVYRIIFELYIYIVPIIPDLGIYIQSILNVLFPSIIFIKMNRIFTKKTFKISHKKNFIRWIISIPLTALTITIIVLVSGLFKYTSIAIGSNSMYPNIKKGDAIIYEKIVLSEYKNIKIGNILVHNHDGKIIVHRVIDIESFNGKYTFHTKGDFNKTSDNYEITENDVVGIYKTKIPYIGLPSVWLSEIFK